MDFDIERVRALLLRAVEDGVIAVPGWPDAAEQREACVQALLDELRRLPPLPPSA